MNAKLLLALVVTCCAACEKKSEEPTEPVAAPQPTAESTSAPPAPEPEALNREQAASTPRPIQTEHECDLSSTYISASVSLSSESLSLGAGGHGHQTSREYLKVSCTQCVGEDFSYGSCPKEFGWDCKAASILLDSVDAGGALRSKDVRVRTVKPVSTAKKLQESVELLLTHLDDAQRYTYLDKAKARALAEKVKTAGAALTGAPVGKKWSESKHDRALLQIGETSNLIAIQDGQVWYLAAAGSLAYGKASCAAPETRSGK